MHIPAPTTAAKCINNAVTNSKLGSDTYRIIGISSLAAAGSSISVAISGVSYIRVILSIVPGTSISNLFLRLNGDSGSNYSYRYSVNGGSSTGISGQSGINIDASLTTGTSPNNSVIDIVTALGQQSSIISQYSNWGTGSTDGVTSVGIFGKWTNTAAISSVSISTGSGNMGIGTKMIVLGA